MVTKSLGEIGLKLEAHFGGPQDVEWARQDDAFIVLQTRPVTLPPQPARW